MYGIDVSENNGVIDWNKIKGNIDFAILRLGWIGNKNNHTIDKQFERNYSECKRLAIPIGIYLFNYCESEEAAKSGANWAIQKLQQRTIDLPIYIDMENDANQPLKLSRLGKTTLTNICIAFNSIIEQNGFWAGVYANRDWYDNYLNKNEIKKRYTTWIAHYTHEKDKYKGEYDMWQNSSSGKIEGISGNVDTNYMYRDLINDIKNSKSTSNSDQNITSRTTERKIGDIVTINGVYVSSDSTNKLSPAKTTGTITRIIAEAKNPYLLDNGNIGWTNDNCIVEHITNNTNTPGVTYIVKKGDTLSAIAKKYNTTYQEIAYKNGIADPNKIYIGQVLNI